jgi:hypothetical protein
MQNAGTPTATGGTPYGYGSWADFTRDFKRAFAPTNSQGDAMASLMNLRQGKSPLVEYIAEFNQLSLRAHVTDDINRCNYFTKGLNPEFMKKLFTTGQAILDNFNSLIDNCNQLDHDWRRYESFRAESSGRNNSYSYQNNPRPRYAPNTSNQKDPNAMDVDRSQFTKLTPELRSQLAKEGKCFYCRKPGHMARECTGKPAKKVRQGGVPETPASIEELDDEEDISACRMDF